METATTDTIRRDIPGAGASNLRTPERCDTGNEAKEPFSHKSYNRGFEDGVNKASKQLDPLEHLFSYPPATQEQLPKYMAIREAAKYFAKVILQNTPHCADQSAAIRTLRDAVFTANAP